MELKGVSYYWEEVDKKRFGQALAWFERRIFRKVSKNLTIGDCLDVGGGVGSKFPVNCESYMLIDKDDAAITRFQEEHPGKKFIFGDFLTIDFKQKYDLILMIQLFTESENIADVVLKAHSLLNDNGLLLFTATNKNSYKGLLYRSKGVAYKTSYYQLKKFLSTLKSSSIKYYGYGWLPFRRDSNSILIPLLKWVDVLFGKFVSISPWLLVELRK
jgi:2-polyprenyl-3-methyl-5-hydroxy-6-metoxy-1,4-benzoquinol methylase